MTLANLTPDESLLNTPVGGNPPVMPRQPDVPASVEVDRRLVESRLGMHASLYFALRAKHPPTAEHCLRVALGCSRWAGWRKLPEPTRDLLEVAALLHDIGKIGVPDVVLQKPGRLSPKELLIMESQRQLAEQLLATAGAGDALLQVVSSSQVRFDQFEQLDAVHLAAGMLAIVDAFDSMTSEQVFRRAMSQERALEELFAHAGTQFAPSLVQDFAVLMQEPKEALEVELRSRWLGKLASDIAPGFHARNGLGEGMTRNNSGTIGTSTQDLLFHKRLLDSLTDGVVYLGRDGKILSWNRGAEQLVGRQSASVLHRNWSAELMGLRDLSGDKLTEEQCPLRQLARTNAQWDERYRIHGAHGSQYTVLLRAMPVFSQNREYCGVLIILRNASAEEDLQEKIESLQVIATSDALTKVANRAELTRQLPEFLSRHLRQGIPGSLIICDIDYFKKINDTFGHQAGDEALVTFAGLLRENARENDLVARYGGEEFVIMCSGCDHSAAVNRAEQMRVNIQMTPVPSLDGRNMTSSFGVTAIQPGDTPETLLARADRALMIAKKNGRNQVVQLGAGQADSDKADAAQVADSVPAQKTRGTWKQWFSGIGDAILSNAYLAAVPKEVVVQKLHGFINDHQAEVVNADENSVVIRVDGKNFQGRRGERPTSMMLCVEIKNVQFACNTDRGTVYQSRSLLNVDVKPYRARDRRSETLQGQATQLLLSFRSYVVAQEIDEALRSKIMEPR
ncbi:MAG: diguanylate cyclase [bacterium]|nr:diguanylate cyclase [bacterium]